MIKDVKIKLSMLWITRLLTGFVGDIIRFFEPGMLEEIMSGALWDGVPLTPEMMLVMAIITVIPAVMVYPSLTLEDRPNRALNRIVGVFMVGFDLLFLITAIPVDPPYEIFLGILYLVFTVLITWNAFKWEKQES